MPSKCLSALEGVYHGESMKKVIDFIEQVQRVVCMICFVVFFVCIVLQVLTRYVPFIKILGIDEIATYSFVWASLLGAAVLIRVEQHFAFDFFRSRAHGVSRLVIEGFIYGLLIIFSFYLMVMGYRLTMKFSTWTLTSLPKVSQAWTWSSLLLSGATMTLYTVEKLVEKVRIGLEEIRK